MQPADIYISMVTEHVNPIVLTLVVASFGGEVSDYVVIQLTDWVVLSVAGVVCVNRVAQFHTGVVWDLDGLSLH